MKQYTITHTCGHTEQHTLDGTTEQSKGRADWLGAKPCTICWNAQKEKARDERVSKIAAEKKLPTLVGTEKQIPWAMAVRQQISDEFEDILEIQLSRGGPVEALRKAYADMVTAKTNANWFLDRHDPDNREAILAAVVDEVLSTEGESDISSK